MLLKKIVAAVGALAVVALATPATVSGGRPIERQFHVTYTAEYQPVAEHSCESGEQANLLLENRSRTGTLSFVDVTASAGPGFETRLSSRGLAAGDRERYRLSLRPERPDQ